MQAGSYLAQPFNDALIVTSKHRNATPTYLCSSLYEVAFIPLKDHPFSAEHSSWYTQGTQALPPFANISLFQQSSNKDRNQHKVLQHLTLLWAVFIQILLWLIVQHVLKRMMNGNKIIFFKNPTLTLGPPIFFNASLATPSSVIIAVWWS